jgi:ribonuclease VapC
LIVDSSAILAIIRNEPARVSCTDALVAASAVRISAASYLEAAVVVDGLQDPLASREFDALIQRFLFRIEPVTERQARIARDAYRDFGRGSGHRARLNFGDCFAYALAKDMDEPLLFIGDDFRHTDVRQVLR